MGWKFDHDPEAKPLGCNGRYGTSGSAKHHYHKTPPCEDCKASARHYARERARGQKYPRVLYPCGTRPAALRHRAKGEPLCLPCKLAEAEYQVPANEARKAARRAAHGKVAA